MMSMNRDWRKKGLTVVIPGRIVGKGRPRFTHKGGHAVAYTPQTTVDAENRIRKAVLEEANGRVFHGPVAVRIEAVFRMPESARKEGTVRGYCLKKPDGDNIAKLVLDAMQGRGGACGVIDDDATVADLTVAKYWGGPDELEDQLVVSIQELDDYVL